MDALAASESGQMDALAASESVQGDDYAARHEAFRDTVLQNFQRLSMPEQALF
jgi:hypothetical protein